MVMTGRASGLVSLLFMKEQNTCLHEKAANKKLSINMAKHYDIVLFIKLA